MKNDNFSEEMNFINAPQFPGQQLGKNSIDQVRALIKRQKRLKGFNHVAPVGESELNLDLSGTARILLGIALFGKADVDFYGEVCWCNFTMVEKMQFTVNNEIVIDQLDPNFLTPNYCDNEYYYIPRPLSGTDVLTIKFTNTGAKSEIVKVVIYYI